MAYPLQIEVNYQEKRSRLTTFFRLLLVIPQIIVLFFVEIARSIATIIAWFALLFTGRWPQGLYNFCVGALRWQTRVSMYLYLLDDTYPPFNLDDDPAYPVRLHMTPIDDYSRLKVLLRIFYIIPAYLIAYVIGIILSLVIFADWIIIVIAGRQPEGLQDVVRFCVTYLLRVQGLYGLITQTYPPFSETA